MNTIINAFKHDADYWIWRRNVGGRSYEKKNGKKGYVPFGQAGMSDIEGIAREIRCPICGTITGRGVHVEIECKSAKGKPTSAQLEWIEAIEKMNGIAFVIYPDENDIVGIRRRIIDLLNQPCSHCVQQKKEIK